jgi:hypothetical protein
MDQHSGRNWIIAPVLAAVLGMAAGEVRAQADVDTNNTVITDFEYNMRTTQWGGYWYSFNDFNSPAASDTTLRGNSQITSADSLGNPFFDDSTGYYDKRSYPLGRSGEADSHSMRMAFAFGDRLLSCGTGCTYQPYVGWGLRLTYKGRPDDTFDMTGATAITFWAKSDTDTVTVNFSLMISDSIDLPDYSQAIKVGPVWKQYTVSLNPATTLLMQPTWAAKKAFDLRHVSGMGFGFNRGENSKVTTNGMSIDEITVVKWRYIDPALVDGIRPWTRLSASRPGWRLQIKGSQVNLMRMDGDRLTPFNLNGRGLPAR